MFTHIYHLAQLPHFLPILLTAPLVIDIQQPNQHHNRQTKHPQEKIEHMLLLFQVALLLLHTQVLSSSIQNVEINIMIVIRFRFQASCTIDNTQLLTHHRQPFRHSNDSRSDNPAHLSRNCVVSIRIGTKQLIGSIIRPWSISHHLTVMLVNQFQCILHLHKSQTVFICPQIIIRECDEHGCLYKIIAIQFGKSQSPIRQFQFQWDKAELTYQLFDEHPT